MKKIIVLLIILILTFIVVGCSTETSSEKIEEEKKAELKEEVGEASQKEGNFDYNSKDNNNVRESNDNIKDDVNEEIESKGVVIDKEDLYSMDSNFFYFMDNDIDFLTMKGAAQNSKDEAYYIATDYSGFDVRYYLAEDKFTVNRITLVANDEEQQEVYNSDGSVGSFMGLYIGMPMELAKDYIHEESPEYDGELEVKYFDNDGDGNVDQIDVYSKKEFVKRVQREDFYFKFFDMNIHDEADHMGNGTGAKETLKIDEENKTYTYSIVFGSDEYQKIYTYNEKDTIDSMELKSNEDEFLAVVPSLFGIQLGSEKDTINQMVKDENKTIYSSKSLKATDSKYDVEEYTIIDISSKIVYTAEVYFDKESKKVKKIKGYFKHKKIVEHDELLDVLDKKLDGDAKKTEGTGSEKWVIDFEAYSDKIIKSAAIYGEEESVFVDTVPSLCGLKLNMFVIGTRNTLVNKGYEVINEERYSPFADESLETIKYTVINTETKKEFNVYITSKYIGDISAAIVVRIAIG